MLDGLEILEVRSGNVSEPSKRAQRFASLLLEKMGARLSECGSRMAFDNAFYRGDIAPFDGTPDEFLSVNPGAVLLVAGEPGLSAEPGIAGNAVYLELDAWQTEETLFAGSGLADLLGDPERAPLVPQANYAAHTIGYALFCAATALHVRHQQTATFEQAVVNGLAVMAWINWKAGAAGALGRDISRQGEKAEWPVVPCKDGHAAFLFTERDWPAVVSMIGDPALQEDRFATFQARAENRQEYMAIVREWVRNLSRAEFTRAFYENGIPGASVETPENLLSDPLLQHANTFEEAGGAIVPRPAARIVAEREAVPADQTTSAGSLPLSGVRILDLGIITAGAGVSAVLADLGADVLKIESATYPDPFRQWAGEDVSPLFKFNNRNKYGVALDLKTPQGRRDFLKLVESADMVLENFRRGVMDRLGLDFEALSEVNPRILLASVSGQGIDGPMADHTTFGSTLEANSGFAALTRYDDGVPVISGRNLNYPDQIVCLYGAGVLTAAVHACRRDGRGRHVDISQRDCAIYQIGDVIAAGSRDEEQNAGVPALSQIVCSANEEYIALSVNERALSELGVIDSRDLSAWAMRRETAAICAEVERAGGGATVCVKGSQMLKDPAVIASDVFANSPSGDLVKGFPFQLRGSPMRIRLDAPAVGQHTNDYLDND